MNAAIQRRITLIRHAKAEDEGAVQDHLRRLNPRGLAEAAALGDWIRQEKAQPELIICSTAQRTRETLAALEIGNVPTILSDKAYLASAGELLSLLQEVDDAVMHVGIVAHNPGLHQLAATLPSEYARKGDEETLMLKFPTSAYVSMEVLLAHWQQLAPQQATLDRLRFKA